MILQWDICGMKSVVHLLVFCCFLLLAFSVVCEAPKKQTFTYMHINWNLYKQWCCVMKNQCLPSIPSPLWPPWFLWLLGHVIDDITVFCGVKLQQESSKEYIVPLTINISIILVASMEQLKYLLLTFFFCNSWCLELKMNDSEVQN